MRHLITAFRPLANANTAIALLVLGLLFEFPKAFPKLNATAIAIRLAIVSAAAACVWLGLIPFGSIKAAMIVVLFAPVPSASPSMALLYGYEGDKVAFEVSVNLIVSVAVMSVLCALLF